MALTNDQLRILVQTVLGEAGGEGPEGMEAVAHVIKNRASSGRYPSDPMEVATQPYQFSAWNKGEGGNNPQKYKPGTPEFERAANIVQQVFSGSAPDPTGGSLFYHTKNIKPKWAREAKTEYGTKDIGGHRFYPRQKPASNSAISAINDATAQQSPVAPTPMPNLSDRDRAFARLKTAVMRRPLTATDPVPNEVLPRFDYPTGGRGVPGGLPYGAPSSIADTYGVAPQPADAWDRVTARNNAAVANQPPNPLPRMSDKDRSFARLKSIVMQMPEPQRNVAPQAPDPMPPINRGASPGQIANATGFRTSVPQVPSQLSMADIYAQGGPTRTQAQQVPGPNGYVVGDKDIGRLPQQPPGIELAYAGVPPTVPPPRPRPTASAPTPMSRIDRKGWFDLGGFRLPGVLGAVQNADHAIANASGPRGNNFDNALINVMTSNSQRVSPTFAADTGRSVEQIKRYRENKAKGLL